MRAKQNLRILWALPLAAVMVLAALPVEAQAVGVGGDAEVATMAVHGGSVSFAPRVSYESMSLTVAGRDHVSEQVFRGGQTASFAPVDSEGFALPDGTYKWEIVVAPRPQDLDLRAFRNGKVSADGRSMEAARSPHGQRQSGVFTIKNGVIADPGLVEAESPRATGTPMIANPPSAAARAAEHVDRDQ